MRRRNRAGLATVLCLFLTGCVDDLIEEFEGEDTPSEAAGLRGIEVSPTSLDFGAVLVGAQRNLSVTVTNTGSSQLEVTTVALEVGTSTDFAITAGPPSVSVAPDASVAILVSYTPTEAGTADGALVIESDDPDQPVITVPLAGTGVSAPVAEVDVRPGALEFGDVLVGESKSLEVTVHNTGSADLQLLTGGFTVATSSDYSLASPVPTGSVAPGASVVLTVLYAPSNVGADTGDVVITTDDADESRVTVALAGNGVSVPSPEIDVTPVLLDFGDVFVDTDSSLSFRVRNSGTAPLEVASVQMGPGTSTEFALMPAAENNVLAPGESMDVEVLYSPTDFVADSRTVRVQSNDADEPLITVSLAGSGVPLPVPEVEVAPLSVLFGDVPVGSHESRTITVDNVGTAELDVESAGLGAGSSGEFAITSGPADALIAPGGRVSLVVTYTPVDTEVDSGSVRIVSNDADEGLVIVSLSGSGTQPPPPEIDVTPAELGFGEVTAGASSSLAVTVSNRGNGTLRLSQVALEAGTSPEFSVNSTPTSVDLVSGESLQVVVTYTPADAGLDVGSLLLVSNDEDEATLAVPLAGSGAVEPAPLPSPTPEIDVTPAALDFGGVPLGSSNSLSLTIDNTGNAALELGNIGLAVGTSLEFALTAEPSTSSVPAGGSVEVVVTYTPAEDGADQGALLIESSDSDEGLTTVPLSGAGISSSSTGVHSITLAWDPPALNVDGSPLTDLAGFKIYDGPTPGVYDMVTDVGDATQFTMSELPSGTYYFAVTAYDLSGNESDVCEPLAVTLP